MKSRQGFVSNSSSTSFCIIGIDCYGGWNNEDGTIRREAIIEALAELDGIDVDEISFGVAKGKAIDYFGSEGEIYNVGMWAKELLQEMTIPNAKEYFVGKVQAEYGVSIPLEFVEFLYGESGSG